MSKASATRLTILEQAASLVYRNGFQQTSIDDILATTQVTKGAFFYHFHSKNDMGLAMIREVLYPGMYEAMVKPLRNAEDPVEEIYVMMKHLLLRSPFFEAKYGCPAVNLIEELAPLNKPFQKALAELFGQWESAIVACVNKGRANGKIKKRIDAAQVASFVLAGYTGIRAIGKMRGPGCYTAYLKELKTYLETLR